MPPQPSETVFVASLKLRQRRPRDTPWVFKSKLPPVVTGPTVGGNPAKVVKKAPNLKRLISEKGTIYGDADIVSKPEIYFIEVDPPDSKGIRNIRKETFRIKPERYFRAMSDRLCQPDFRAALCECRPVLESLRDLRISSTKTMSFGGKSWKINLQRLYRFRDYHEKRVRFDYTSRILYRYSKFCISEILFVYHTLRYLFGILPRDLLESPTDILIKPGTLNQVLGSRSRQRRNLATQVELFKEQTILCSA